MKNNEVKIIGGNWRSRKIQFSDRADLRPTPNRVRETLFNWLAPYINSMKCLDLFAGSGALSFEALSRGASHATMVDRSFQAINNLKKNAAILNANCDFYCLQFSTSLDNPFKHHFDLVFLDPPFHKNLVSPCCQWLEQNCLAEHAFIYIENEKTLGCPKVPENWQLLRHKTAGEVCYSLFQRVGKES